MTRASSAAEHDERLAQRLAALLLAEWRRTAADDDAAVVDQDRGAAVAAMADDAMADLDTARAQEAQDLEQSHARAMADAEREMG